MKLNRLDRLQLGFQVLGRTTGYSYHAPLEPGTRYGFMMFAGDPLPQIIALILMSSTFTHSNDQKVQSHRAGITDTLNCIQNAPSRACGGASVKSNSCSHAAADYTSSLLTSSSSGT